MKLPLPQSPFTALATVLTLSLCTRGIAGAQASSGTDTNRQVFQVRGVIKRVVPAEHRVVIAHEEITNYMAAMTMPFHVRNTNELTGLKPGDAVSFRYVVLPDDDWIEQVRRVAAAHVAPARTNAVSIAPVVELLKVGDPLPAVTFTNHHGQTVALADLRGQAVALGFFFSRCPAADVCPRQTAELAATGRHLAASATAPANWRLLCFTLDPEHDTPSALNTVAKTISPAESRLEFLTGDVIALRQFAARCGVIAMPETNSIRHNLRVVVVNTAGRVQNIFKGGQWTPDELVAALIRAATVSVSQSP